MLVKGPRLTTFRVVCFRKHEYPPLQKVLQHLWVMSWFFMSWLCRDSIRSGQIWYIHSKETAKRTYKIIVLFDIEMR